MKKNIYSIIIIVAFLNGCGGESGTVENKNPSTDKKKVINKVSPNTTGIEKDISPDQGNGAKNPAITPNVGGIEKNISPDQGNGAKNPAITPDAGGGIEKNISPDA